MDLGDGHGDCNADGKLIDETREAEGWSRR